ncbi:Fpg/Nei family DNA glycosylase [Fodinibius sediminis]|nr:DNA-formamidopyrimidine glycosylase family protein [Fodinibius sediminis]
MPELPEVRYFKKYIDATSLHKPIQRTRVHNPEVLRDLSSQKLQSCLKGVAFESTYAHGKYLFLQAGKSCQLVLHFGMTGRPVYYKTEDHTPDYPRAIMDFENGAHLAFDCMRMLGNISLTTDREHFLKDKKLGPDALRDLSDPETFLRLFEDKRGMIKTTLMDQHFIAGIGNVCSDEILFQSMMHPKKNIPTLGENELRTLHENVALVLETYVEAVPEYETIPDSFLFNYRSEGKECPRCGTAVEKIPVGSRSAYYCPDCQSR